MSSLMFETSRWRCFQRQVGWVSIFAVNTQSLDTFPTPTPPKSCPTKIPS
jgi:hypothetical protein